MKAGKIIFSTVIVLLVLIILGLILYITNVKNNPTVANESLFDKQQQCANNRESAQKQLEDSFKMAIPYFYDIFYSPKTGTCVYTYGLILSGQSPNEVGSFVIADYFTGKELYSVHYDNSSGDENQYSYTVRPQFEDMVAQYQK